MPAASLDGDEPALAREALTSAVAIAPTSAETYFLLALALRRLDDRDAAERAVRTAVELDPKHGLAAHYLGALLAEKEVFDHALPWLRRGVELAPEVAQHHRDLGVVELFLGEVTRGRASLMHAANSIRWPTRRSIPWCA